MHFSPTALLSGTIGRDGAAKATGARGVGGGRGLGGGGGDGGGGGVGGAGGAIGGAGGGGGSTRLNVCDVFSPRSQRMISFTAVLSRPKPTRNVIPSEPYSVSLKPPHVELM